MAHPIQQTHSAPDLYTATAEELVNRIVALLPTHPELLSPRDRDPWTLFDVGLECDDLAPTLFQADWALSKARHVYLDRKKEMSVK